MERDKIFEIASKCKINGEVFYEFMRRRFPNEGDPCYVETWAKRFSEGVPQLYMDSISKRVFQEVVAEYGK